MDEFVVMDCVLLTRMSGISPAQDLRELRDRLTACSSNSLIHHFCETPLRHTFDDPDYRNDFAVWSRQSLADNVLAERLGIIDPYEIPNVEDLRQSVIDIVEDRLSELAPMVPGMRGGREFYFIEATSIVFETPKRISHPNELSDAVKSMTPGSIYFHFLESRRREPLRKDDFSVWIEKFGEEGQRYADSISHLDFYFKTLLELRTELSTAFGRAAA